MKRLLTLIVMALLLCFSLTAFAAQKEVSSIDALDKGVADTGETHFTKTDRQLTECTLPYTVAVLPYMDTSGLEGRSREMAVGAIKDTLKIKYPAKKTSVTKIVSNNLVQRAMINNPMENPEVPTLDELVASGEACGADRVIFVSILPAREKETGFMMIAGTQTYSATVMMKLKCLMKILFAHWKTVFLRQAVWEWE